MSRFSQKGSVFLFLVVFFAVVATVAGVVVYQTFTNASKKISKQADSLNVALKTEYQNPFDKNTQYTNPFSDYQNPFDNLK